MSSWEQILELTARMHESAQAAEWEQLVELESLRNPLITQHFSSSVSPDDGEAVRVRHEQITQLMNTDQKISQLVEAARDDSARVMALFTQGKRATTAYSENKV